MSQDTFDQGSRDAIDGILDQWHVERPDLDPSAKAILGRIIRLEPLIQQAYHEAFAPIGINEKDYGVLVVLRRAGAPYQLTPTDLARQRMITSGGMTAALDRLERKGLITRLPNPSDRRGSLVALTEAGLAVVDEAMVRHTAAEHEQVAALDEAERAQLAALLRKLLLAVEARASR
jgi:DNA-binding MarR family transcriptional regulator